MNQEDQKKLTPVGALKLLQWACEQQQKKSEGCEGCDMWLEEPEPEEFDSMNYCWLKISLCEDVPPYDKFIEEREENDRIKEKKKHRKFWKASQRFVRVKVVEADTAAEAAEKAEKTRNSDYADEKSFWMVEPYEGDKRPRR